MKFARSGRKFFPFRVDRFTAGALRAENQIGGNNLENMSGVFSFFVTVCLLFDVYCLR